MGKESTVGASLACALAGSSLKVAVVEAMAPGDSKQPGYDDWSFPEHESDI